MELRQLVDIGEMEGKTVKRACFAGWDYETICVLFTDNSLISFNREDYGDITILDNCSPELVDLGIITEEEREYLEAEKERLQEEADKRLYSETVKKLEEEERKTYEALKKKYES